MRTPKDYVSVRLSITPNSVPITPEQLAKLPYPPDERTRSNIYYTDVGSRDDAAEGIGYLLEMKKEFEEAFGMGFEAFFNVELEGREVFVSPQSMKLLADFGCCLEIMP